MIFEKIKYILFLFALLSLCLLLLSMYFFVPQKYSVSDFLISENSDVVVLSGVIRNTKQSNSSFFFNLCDGSKCVDCVLFNASKYQSNLLFNENNVLLTGKLDDKFLVYKVENDYK